jgi:hypothetical protein
VREQTLEQVERRFHLAQARVAAGDVVLREYVVRIDCHRARQPFHGTLAFAHGEQGAGTEVGWPRILGMQRQLAFGSLDRPARDPFDFPVAAE